MNLNSLLRYYSHVSYRNGFRHEPSCSACSKANTSLNLLSFETGFYGLAFDIQDLSKIWFQRFCEALPYQSCFSIHQNRMDSLEEETFTMKITVGGVTYTCSQMAPPNDECKPFNGTTILWEAGKVAQRFELSKLVFLDAQGNKLDGIFSLTIQVWPDVFALTLKADEMTCCTAHTSVTLQLKDWLIQQCFSGAFALTLPCSIHKRVAEDALIVTTDAMQDNEPAIVTLPTRFQASIQAYETKVKYWYTPKAGCLVRKFEIGYTDIRDYDDYQIILDQKTSTPTPYVLSIGMPANITGMCPILLTKDGIPSGIPVQLSKNWHWEKKGPYAKLYIIIPTSGSYILRITYGFYGTLPAASHAQLCLYGYGSNNGSTGRWDQMAIGCWGETFCLDSEFSCGVDRQITDVRGLMMRHNNAPDEKWNWSNCAWGGDWLRAYAYATTARLYVNQVKVAYLAHGPCLTNVRYYGYYGAGAIKFEIGVRTLRTDDYCRTFLQFNYQIQKKVSLENGYLHNMLQRAFCTPTVVYGNSNGMVQELSVPDGLKANQLFVKNQSFEGNAPFWIAFPDSDQHHPDDKTTKSMPTGTKNMIVRDFTASVGGSCYKRPAFSLVQEVSGWVRQTDKPSIMVNLELPNGIQTMNAGDSVHMEIEWTTLSRQAGEYYGPNKNYKAFLSMHPKSWKILFREAQLNGSLLTVHVNKDGGELLHTYPIAVKVTNDDGVTLRVDGGTGAMPMEFCGLTHSNYRLYLFSHVTGEDHMLDQSSRVGNDYWQTEYDFSTKTYTMTFNPRLGDVWSTVWKLKKYKR